METLDLINNGTTAAPVVGALLLISVFSFILAVVLLKKDRQISRPRRAVEIVVSSVSFVVFMACIWFASDVLRTNYSHERDLQTARNAFVESYGLIPNERALTELEWPRYKPLDGEAFGLGEFYTESDDKILVQLKYTDESFKLYRIVATELERPAS